MTMYQSSNGEYIIDWDDEKDIVELIKELAQLLTRGHKTIKIETEMSSDEANGGETTVCDGVNAYLVSDH